MADNLSDTESELTTEGSSQDEFESVEVEAIDGVHENNTCEDDATLEPYADEPIADEEWLKKYRKEQEEKRTLEEELTKRLENRVRVGEWFTCGNCSQDLLANISECYCCKELEGCCEALTSDIVLAELQEGHVLNCVTEHPGFKPVCLEKWSLRLAGGKYRTKDRQRYRKTGSEERYLRSIAYREFSRLVYGFLGKKRIPLPACAYSAIRKEFPAQDDETQYRSRHVHGLT